MSQTDSLQRGHHRGGCRLRALSTVLPTAWRVNTVILSVRYTRRKGDGNASINLGVYSPVYSLPHLIGRALNQYQQ